MRRLLLGVLVCVGCGGSSSSATMGPMRGTGGGFVGVGDDDGGAPIADAQPAQVADVQPAPPPPPDAAPADLGIDAGPPLPVWIVPWPTMHPPIPDPMAPDNGCLPLLHAICFRQLVCTIGEPVPDTTLNQCILGLFAMYPALDHCQAVFAVGDNHDQCVGEFGNRACSDTSTPPDCAGALILRP